MLPIDSLRPRFEAALDNGPVVLAAPTGSGKSTQVPRWCGTRGTVLVVEPRRVACRALAQRVAELEGVALGKEVGYSVRDDHRASAQTRILFATPGVVLLLLSRGRDLDWQTVILDEFHERRLDVDLLLALVAGRGSLVVMSATLDAEAVAGHLQAAAIEGGERLFPVEIRHLAGRTLLPSERGLEGRLSEAVEQARQDPGDILIFLPGKGEIRAAAEKLGRGGELEVLPLHGGLTLEQQSLVFSPGKRRRVILATNVAETSITVPGVGVVIDSGLVRRTRYHAGRGYLTMVPVAIDSAEQRAGRAGRTAPGVCYRLWSADALLEPQTPPEVHRESLVPLVLAAAACGRRADTLPLLDAPKEHALEAALEELHALGALAQDGTVTERGRRLFGLPLDPWLGRLLVEAEQRGSLADAVDLAAALEAGRPLFARRRPDEQEQDLREAGCDATALIRAVRLGDPEAHGLDRHALAEARATSRRLRIAFDLPERPEPNEAVQTERLARTAVAADPRCVYVARRRRGRVAWSNGGTEIELAKGSAVDGAAAEAIVVFASRAVAGKARSQQVIATCATPLRSKWMMEAGLGRDRLARVTVVQGAVCAMIERVFARKVIATRDEEPEGELARSAVCELVLRGSIFKGVAAQITERLEAASLLRRLRLHGILAGEPGEPVPEASDWLLARLEGLGLERGSDLALLAAEDLLPDELEWDDQQQLERHFPRRIEMVDAVYQVLYDLGRSEVTLERIRGPKKSPPPPLHYLPRFAGMRILFKHHSQVRVLRERE